MCWIGSRKGGQRRFHWSANKKAILSKSSSCSSSLISFHFSKEFHSFPFWSFLYSTQSCSWMQFPLSFEPRLEPNCIGPILSYDEETCFDPGSGHSRILPCRILVKWVNSFWSTLMNQASKNVRAHLHLSFFFSPSLSPIYTWTDPNSKLYHESGQGGVELGRLGGGLWGAMEDCDDLGKIFDAGGIEMRRGWKRQNWNEEE